MPNLVDSAPIASVIIVNYNNGRFLLECFNSIIDQTYKHIEIIIVDNKSQDDSEDIIQDLVSRNKDVKVIMRSNNGGQTLACAEGVKASNGEFIVFVDSDDYLLPHFVETHLRTHLSLRIPVGVTSADMIQRFNDQLVVGTRQEVSDYILKNSKIKNPMILRPIQALDEAFFPSAHGDTELHKDIYFVHPHSAHWVWPPISGHCFRRDAINLFINNSELQYLMVDTDTYFVMGISCLTGSVLIDRALAVYRMHGKNSYARHPQLNQVIAYDKQGTNGKLARETILHHFIVQHKLFLNKSPSYKHFRKIIEEIGWHISRKGNPFYLTRLAIRNFGVISATTGRWRLLWWILRWAAIRI